MNAPIFDPPNLPQCIKYLSALVSFNSASSDVPAADHGNEALIDWAMAELTAAGLTCRKIQTAPGKFNLIADTHPRLPLGLIFSGHSDTVPADPALWHSDPWTLTESCGMLYGLGACDMKGALACFMTAAAAAAELSRRMPDFFERGIRLLFTADTTIAEFVRFSGGMAASILSLPAANTSMHFFEAAMLHTRSHNICVLRNVLRAISSCWSSGSMFSPWNDGPIDMFTASAS